MNFSGYRINKFGLLLFVITMSQAAIGLASDKSCFDAVSYVTPETQTSKRALYILIDETIPLSAEMKKNVLNFLPDWGKPGDMVKISRFSASYRGLYPKLVYFDKIEMMPDDRYLFNLQYKDKKNMKRCLEQQKLDFKQNFHKMLKASLNNINPKIPKSELLDSLKLLSKQLYLSDKADHKTLLFITDGLENSPVTSFYANGKIRKIKLRKEIDKIRRKGKLGFWKKANVYIYGLGLVPDKKTYVKPETIEQLKRFWEQYFVESGAKVIAIGTPELLLTSIK